MFSYDFREKRGKNIAVYGPSLALKGLCAFFLIPIAIGFFIALDEHTLSVSSIVPVVVALLLIITILFSDEWVFDNNKKEIESRFGFGPFVKREKLSYDDIERIEVTHFIKGIPEYSENQKPSWKHKAQVVLALCINSDDKRVLEVMGEKKSAGKLERGASWLAGYTGLSLYIDRARDTKI